MKFVIIAIITIVFIIICMIYVKKRIVYIYKPVIKNNVIKCKVYFKGKYLTFKNTYYNTDLLLNDDIEGYINLFIPHLILSGDVLITSCHVDETYMKNLKQVILYYEKCLHKKFKLNIYAPIIHKKYEAKKSICTFTGGIDSFYTLLSKESTIDSILYCINYDIYKNQTELLKQQIEVINTVSESLGKKVIICETNNRMILQNLKSYNCNNTGDRWGVYLHGICIFNHAYNLSNYYSEFYFPSTLSMNNEWKLWGSDHNLDKHYSSLHLHISTHGNIDRFQKTQFLCLHKKNKLVFDNLKVCWINSNKKFNCSKCDKCIRTIISIGAVDEKNLTKLKTFIINKSFDELKKNYFSKNDHNFVTKSHKNSIKHYLSIESTS